MGLIQKKDEKDVIDGIEVIGRSDTPDDLPETEFDLVAGESAEDIAAGTTAAERAAADEAQMVADAHDEALMDAPEGDGPDEGGDGSEGDGSEGSEGDGPDPAGEPEPASGSGDGGDNAGSGDDGGSGDGGDSGAGVAPAPAEPGGSQRRVLFIASLVIVVILVAVGGYFVGSGGFGGKKGLESATPTEDQLDRVVASWTYDGKKHDLTAREAIESQYSLDAVKNDDGTYPAPTADAILTLVRREILLQDAEDRGITASKKEMKSYAETNLGSSDYDAIAQQYGLTKSQAKDIVRQSAILTKLQEQIVPSDSVGTMPEAPTEPSDGNSDTASKEYAEYIIDLAGDEWDADKGTWASDSGTIHDALEGEEFTADSATYAQAQKAYYAAYQAYSDSSTKASDTWSTYVNGLYAKADISLYGLYM